MCSLSWSKEEAAQQRNEAIEVEFAHMFGTEYHNVTKWQDLCRLIGLETEGLTSITKCKKVCTAHAFQAWSTLLEG